jgi:hypothetical protein
MRVFETMVLRRIFGLNVHVARMGEMGHAHTILVRKSERKRPYVRPESRWEKY